MRIIPDYDTGSYFVKSYGNEDWENHPVPMSHSVDLLPVKQQLTSALAMRQHN